jgi:hypothetical protein
MPHYIDVRHLLDEHGELPLELPVRRQALRFAQLIEAGGPLEVGEFRETLVPCSSRLHRRACLGLLWVEKSQDDRIWAYCLVCRRAEIFISGWQDTIWANGPMEAVKRERSTTTEPAQIFN